MSETHVSESDAALRGVDQVTWGRDRRGQPVTIGVPLPPGMASTPADLRLARAGGAPEPVQARCLDRWPDGSVRWALLDFQANAVGGTVTEHVLRAGSGAVPAAEE